MPTRPAIAGSDESRREWSQCAAGDAANACPSLMIVDTIKAS